MFYDLRFLTSLLATFVMQLSILNSYYLLMMLKFVLLQIPLAVVFCCDPILNMSKVAVLLIECSKTGGSAFNVNTTVVY